MPPPSQPVTTSLLATVCRVALGAFLLLTGMAHLTSQRQEFQAQVPRSLPFDPDFDVVASGIVEIILGAALIALPRFRVAVGWLVAAFFVAVFPGNMSQFLNGTDAFGLDTDLARFLRLFLQPVLVTWALWSTGAWAEFRERRAAVVSSRLVAAAVL